MIGSTCPDQVGLIYDTAFHPDETCDGVSCGDDFPPPPSPPPAPPTSPPPEPPHERDNGLFVVIVIVSFFIVSFCCFGLYALIIGDELLDGDRAHREDYPLLLRSRRRGRSRRD